MDTVSILKELLPNFEVDYERITPPKGRFNTESWNADEKYSDGEVEEELLYKIVTAKTEELSALADSNDWPAFIHFSDVRKNILKWYEFDREKEVLEIGCGMGAVTELLCQKCKNVTAVELSLRRGISTLYRCRDYGNLDVIVGNLNEIHFDRKFDYITLIGVLEYQGSYTDDDDPFLAFLRKIRPLLKEDGKLFVAIENKCGLKYWCGAKEDHTSTAFDGLNHYQLSQLKPRTFSKQEMSQMLERAGFSSIYFYYPYPDYKLPMDIFSEQKLPQSLDDMKFLSNVNGSEDTIVIEDRVVMDDIIRNGVGDFFANSFLIECSKTEMGERTDRVLYASFTNQRKKEYRIETVYKSSGVYIKRAYEEASKAHLKRLCQNLADLKGRGLQVISVEETDTGLIFPEIKEQTLSAALSDAIMDLDREKIRNLLELQKRDILRSSEIVKKDGEGTILRVGYVDMAPQNAFLKDGRLLWFDQEWKKDNIPMEYIVCRGLKLLYEKNPKLSEKISLDRLLAQGGINFSKESFEKYEREFAGENIHQEIRLLKQSDGHIVKNNVERFCSLSDVLDRFLEFYVQKPYVFIYGAGYKGRQTERILAKMNLDFEAFLVSDHQKKGETDKKPVLFLSECINNYDVKDVAVIVAIQNTDVRNEIIKNLEQKGISAVYAV